ncbi:50S ribosomal protein L11 methyltransferase [Guyparkeria hydrothermalis]|uniref:50S ribosomal protein L11 methyltransferase n=1 Tax=Guyparkeria hydrothermalis TaxID=923 RepID=UPI0020219072|nr:50S ribosomal protein L11 methyltransferase [Guyparkeria hydrothermalis]MCL7745443.1 50S ribosomal protein L11 methyltransferase [Guyparkeria hydrothermalis]
MAQEWQHLWLEVPRDDVEAVEDALLAAGALSVTLEELGDEPVLEPQPGESPLWAETRVVGLFEGDVSPATIVGTLHGLLRPALLDRLGHSVFDEEDWVRRTQADFQAMPIGERLMIEPAWDDSESTGDRLPIRLDPGLAFGTGKHETTRLCLEWLETQDIAGQHWLDAGCGSGILAIAALRLGAGQVDGTDIDPQALTASRGNAELNDIDPARFSLYLAADYPADRQVDGLLANILAPTLIELAPMLSRHLKPGARFVLSGILTHQADAVAAAWQAAGCRVDTFGELGDWALVAGHRPT